MGELFKDMLGADESVFKNIVALDFSFQPKLIKYREKEQFAIANCIKPLFIQQSGRHVLVYGKPGIGKTVAVKHVFKELEEDYDEVVPIYINCWTHNTSHKVAQELCDQIGYKFIQNKKTPELFKEIVARFNKTSVVIAFDEVDKAEDFDFLYTLLEEVYRKTIILISNYREWFINLDERIKSRLNPEQLNFKEYSFNETRGILDQRRNLAFYTDVMPDNAFNIIVDHAYQHKDIRTGLHLMKEAGFIAEDQSNRNVFITHVKKALEKLSELNVKDTADLEEDASFILNIIKMNSGKRIGDLFKIYQENAGKSSYRTFSRRINRLAEGKFISVKKLAGGAEGSTTLISYQSVKKLTEF